MIGFLVVFFVVVSIIGFLFVLILELLIYEVLFSEVFDCFLVEFLLLIEDIE